MDSPSTAKATGLTLVISGIGHVPSKKNKHFPAHHPDGKRLIVLLDDKVKVWIRQCIAVLESQCISKFPMTDGGISTAEFRRFLIASLPHDDNYLNVSELGPTTYEKVPEGQEGAIITIEPLP